MNAWLWVRRLEPQLKAATIRFRGPDFNAWLLVAVALVLQGIQTMMNSHEICLWLGLQSNSKE